MKTIKTDICIIGAGSGGLSVAAGAAQMGARVVLIEADKMGGDCLNYGCVPSKALIAAAGHAHAMTTGAAFGVAPAVPQVDFAAAKDHVRRVIETIAPLDSQERFEGLGVTVLRARGRFVSARAVEAGDTRVEARRFVIATGSAPLVPPIPGLDSVTHYTNETIFDLRERPSHLVIVGGGPIGMEMAQAHRRLGCEVTVIEAQRALGRDDPELAAVVVKRLRGEGIEILENLAVESLAATATGAIEVNCAGGRKIAGSHLLLAVGRRANIGDLGLDAAGVAHERIIKVDAGLRTSNRRIYAIGDVAGQMQFTHVAAYQAGVIIRSMLFGLPSRQRTDHIAWASYTDPELAQVGLSEAEARKRHGDAIEVLRFDFAHNDRAVASGHAEGLVKVIAHRGRPIGAAIVGAQAGELIGLWSLAIAARLKLSAVAGMVLPYPTLSEVNKRAAGAYFSPRLFESDMVKRIVGLVQRLLP